MLLLKNILLIFVILNHWRGLKRWPELKSIGFWGATHLGLNFHFDDFATRMTLGTLVSEFQFLCQ